MSHWSSTTRFRRITLLAGAVLLLSMLLAACADDEDPVAEEPDEEEPDIDEPEDDPDDPDDPEEPVEDEAGFDPDLVAAAQEEGELVLYTGSHTRESAELAAELFEEEFGIPVVFNRQPSGAIMEQVASELAADALEADVVGLNFRPGMTEWAEEGVIVDAEIPNRDDLIDLDPGDTPYVAYTWLPMGIIYNTLAIEDPPTSWMDLTDPAEEGRIVHADPETSGVASVYAAAMLEIVGEEFYEGLGDQDVITTESGTAVALMAATGEVDLAIPGVESLLAPLLEDDEPIAVVYPEEGVPAALSWLAMTADAPNPNAAQLFMHYHLSEDSQVAHTEIGQRAMLPDAPLPAGAEEVDVDELVIPDDAELQEQRDELFELFNAHVR